MTDGKSGLYVYVSGFFTWLFGVLQLLSLQDYLSLAGMLIGAACTIIALRRNMRESALRTAEEVKRTQIIADMVKRVEEEGNMSAKAQLVSDVINRAGGAIPRPEDTAVYVESARL